MASTSKYSGKSSWIVKRSLLAKMITAENGKQFQSSPFNMCGLRWCVEVYPNGSTNNSVGSFVVSLKLLSLPQNGNKILVGVRIHCKESGSSGTFIHLYKKDSSFGWSNYTLSLKEITNNNFIQLSLFIQAKVLRILNERIFKNTITFENDLYFNQLFETQKYIFTIDTQLTKLMKQSLNGKRFESPIYDNIWSLRIAPNGWNEKSNGDFKIGLVICAFPKDVSKLMVRWRIQWSDMQINTDQTDTFEIENSYSQTIWSCSQNILSFDTFRKHFNKFVLGLSIDILEIYDNKNKKVDFTNWNKYLQENKNTNEFEEKTPMEDDESVHNIKLQSIITRMDEINANIKSLSNTLKTTQQKINDIEMRVVTIEENEQKQNVKQSDSLMTQLTRIQQQINKLTKLKLVTNAISEKDKIINWMQNTVKLGQYTEIFFDNGFETIESIYEITKEDLIEMGIDKMGHRKILLKHIQKLRNIKQQKVIKPIYYPHIQLPAAPIACNANMNNCNWTCEMCDTENGNDVLLCTLCGLKRTYKKIEIEGPHVVDTAK